MNKKELLSKLKAARSWKEAGVSVQDVYKAILESVDGVSSTSLDEKAEKELSELREKVNRLTETNKQLRAENKQLRGAK